MTGGNEGRKGKRVFSQITLVNSVLSVSGRTKKPTSFLSCCFVHVCPVLVRRLNIYKIESAVQVAKPKQNLLMHVFE